MTGHQVLQGLVKPPEDLPVSILAKSELLYGITRSTTCRTPHARPMFNHMMSWQSCGTLYKSRKVPINVQPGSKLSCQTLQLSGNGRV